jgi:hypothetical protein
VLGESWPVWQQVLTKSRGFNCAAVYTNNQSVLSEWPAHFQTTHWASIHKFSPANHSNTTQYALVGSNQFVRCYLPALPPSARVLVCLHLQQSPWPEVTGPSWSWVSIAHSSCGGVTTGRYWYGNQSLISAQRIWHHLKPFVSGATCEPPFDLEASHGVAVREQGSLHPRCFFPITAPRTRVKAPCVFSGTGWVVRALMVREFAAYCDTQESLVKTLPDIPVTKVAMTDIPFSVNLPARPFWT